MKPAPTRGCQGGCCESLVRMLVHAIVNLIIVITPDWPVGLLL